MLALLFSLGSERYALEAKAVVEVLPAVPLRPLPQAPPFVSGVFAHRDHVVPVVDLRQLIRQEPCLRRLSSRIILVRCPLDSGANPLLGLMAEQVTDAVPLPENNLKAGNLAIRDAPYLGKIALQNGDLVQLIRLERVLSKTVRDNLFRSE
ncbi:MAG: chemotaxis protein CheW [Candidatus Methylacidiphilales bacterium]